MKTPGRREIDAVFVNPVVGIQTPANRFGRPNIEREIRAKIAETPQNQQAFDDDDFDEDTESDVDNGSVQQILDTGGLWNGQPDDGAGDDSDSESSVSSSTHEVPQFARFRMNLTALSQVYNLYFVACRGKIHVYAPQNAPQVIRDAPLLILQPRPSEVAAMCQGHVDQASGHQVTNMMVGELGDLEVLLAAFDDGDVVGYYTHAVAAAVEHGGRRTKASGAAAAAAARPPKEFFHTAMGKSAWGLAVHKKSRLIAVSSNMVEITVFAFALKPEGERGSYRIEKFDDGSPMLASSGLRATELEKHLRSRTRDWRIILPIPTNGGHNMPSIGFLDDENGNGDKVIAVDIMGHCWVHDIWTLGGPATQIPLPHDMGVTGWGLLVLPDHLFKPVRTPEEFLGMPADGVDGTHSADGRIVLDISSCVELVPENPTSSRVPDRFGNPRHQLQVPATTVSVEVDSLFPPDVAGNDVDSASEEEDRGRDRIVEFEEKQKRWNNLRKAESDPHTPKAMSVGLDTDDGAGRGVEMTIVPSAGVVYKHDGLSAARFLQDIIYSSFRRRHLQTLRVLRDNRAGLLTPRLARQFSILRTSETDVALCSLDMSSASVVCRRLIERHNPDNVREPWDMDTSARICMVQCIPELKTVVVGSACGRVALLRLTKAVHHRGGRVRHGFRVEWVLPRTAEETAKVRPRVWMVGMAVSPVPQPGGRGTRLFPPEQSERRRHQPCRREPVARWRLMLHYMDHTVLTYTIEASDPRTANTPLDT